MNVLASQRWRALVGRSAQPQRRREAEERCELCAQTLPESHRHVLERATHALLCACPACAVLFDHGAAGGDHYRLVPNRSRRLANFRLDELGWRALGVPVEIAFFVRSGEGEGVTAFYPSPAGATEEPLAADAWEELERPNPEVRGLRPEVEALLVNRLGGASEAWVVGVDTCYRLVAVVRANWQGFGGGAVWDAVARFFAELERGGR
jgi:hypothetical protein